MKNKSDFNLFINIHIFSQIPIIRNDDGNDDEEIFLKYKLKLNHFNFFNLYSTKDCIICTIKINRKA